MNPTNEPEPGQDPTEKDDAARSLRDAIAWVNLCRSNGPIMIGPHQGFLFLEGEAADVVACLEAATRGFQSLMAETERLRAERDAALAVAFHAGKSLTSLDEDTVYRMAGEAFRAWLRPDHEDRFRVTRPDSARIRREAGLEP